MTISEAMKITGLTRKAIYLYEDRGLIKPNKDGAYRDYSKDDISRLITIARLRELDVSLNEIAKVLEGVIGIDILLQEHLVRRQEHLNSLVNNIAQLNTIIYNLPPHSALNDFEKAADMVLPRKVSAQISTELEKEYPKSHIRRLAMQIYEAFLDVPLDTPEKWDAWYSLLELLEESDNELVIEAHTEYYGNMTTDQIFEDYRNRRRLVCSYLLFSEAQMIAKADEIIYELKRLINEPETAKQWLRYYQKVVLSMREWAIDDASQYLKILSNVYQPYNDKFNEIKEKWLAPYFKTDEGRQLMKDLKQVCGTCPVDEKILAVYFDFYNNTIRKVLYPELGSCANTCLDVRG